MQGWIGNARAIAIASVVMVSVEVDAQTPGSFNPLDVGSTSTASDAKLNFHSSGSGSTIDSQIVSTSGTSGTPNQATLILNSKIANFQGNIAAYRRIDQVYSAPGDSNNNMTVGGALKATNTGSSATGYLFSFNQQAAAGSGYSIGVSTLANMSGLGGGQGLASWLVTQSPTNLTSWWGVYGSEVNSINLGGDTGYSRKRGLLANWTGGIQIVPESTDILTGSTRGAYNELFGLVVTHSGSSSSATGFNAQSYNGILIEEDAIAPAGVGVQIEGAVARTTSGTLPMFGVRVDSAWSDAAVDTRDATISSGNAITLGDGQRICFAGTGKCVSHSGGLLSYDSNGTQSLTISDSGVVTIAGRKVVPPTAWTPTITADSGTFSYTLVDATYSQTNGVLRGSFTIYIASFGSAAGALKFTAPTTPYKGGIAVGMVTLNSKSMTGVLTASTNVVRMNLADASSPFLANSYYTVNFSYDTAD